MLKNKSRREAKSLKDIPENYDIGHIIDIVYKVAGEHIPSKSLAGIIILKRRFCTRSSYVYDN